MDVVFVPFLGLLIKILEIYGFFLSGYIILGWLEFFGVVNRYNNFVYTIHNFLFSIIEPALRPIRRFVPLFGSVDLSPIVLIMGIYFIENVLISIIKKFPM
jgi:YggT family protein